MSIFWGNTAAPGRPYKSNPICARTYVWVFACLAGKKTGHNLREALLIEVTSTTRDVWFMFLCLALSLTNHLNRKQQVQRDFSEEPFHRQDAPKFPMNTAKKSATPCEYDSSRDLNKKKTPLWILTNSSSTPPYPASDASHCVENLISAMNCS